MKKLILLGLILITILIAGCTQQNPINKNTTSLNNTQVICKATTCQKLGYNCGNWSDECGGTLNCGTCPIYQKCNNGNCSCNPETCSSLGKECGRWYNGCNQTIDCGIVQAYKFVILMDNVWI